MSKRTILRALAFLLIILSAAYISAASRLSDSNWWFFIDSKCYLYGRKLRNVAHRDIAFAADLAFHFLLYKDLTDIESHGVKAVIKTQKLPYQISSSNATSEDLVAEVSISAWSNSPYINSKLINVLKEAQNDDIWIVEAMDENLGVAEVESASVVYIKSNITDDAPPENSKAMSILRIGVIIIATVLIFAAAAYTIGFILHVCRKGKNAYAEFQDSRTHGNFQLYGFKLASQTEHEMDIDTSTAGVINPMVEMHGLDSSPDPRNSRTSHHHDNEDEDNDEESKHENKSFDKAKTVVPIVTLRNHSNQSNERSRSPNKGRHSPSTDSEYTDIDLDQKQSIQMKINHAQQRMNDLKRVENVLELEVDDHTV